MMKITLDQELFCNFCEGGDFGGIIITSSVFEIENTPQNRKDDDWMESLRILSLLAS